ncbi:MAG: glycosyltransferase family 2 protein, partial [Ilumatobacteraceae bacterium]
MSVGLDRDQVVIGADSIDDVLVSVYVAAHDAEAFVGEAIESCLAQTHSRLEVIVVDDASSDRTAAIVESCDDPRVKLVRLDANVGPGPARNVALDASSGEWLAVLDADDVMHPDRVRSLLEWARRHPGHELLVDDSVRWFSDSVGAEALMHVEVADAPQVRSVAPDVWVRRHLGGKPMFRRSLLDTGVRYPDFRAGQDTSFLAQLAV